MAGQALAMAGQTLAMAGHALAMAGQRWALPGTGLDYGIRRFFRFFVIKVRNKKNWGLPNMLF